MAEERLIHEKYKVAPIYFFLFAVAFFTIPSLASVTENNSTLRACSSLATIPPSATLATEVIVFLSSMDGTGEL